MARRFFKIKLSEDAEIQVFIEIVSGLIVNFVVKLILTINSDGLVKSQQLTFVKK
jgi:hypothetical protein